MTGTRKGEASEERVSAEVILKPRGGGQAAAITAATVHAYLPDPATVKKAAEWFAKRGFTIEAAGPMSFSISAPPSTFREVLKMHGRSLTKPKDLEQEVEAVTFTEPPELY